MKTEELKAKSFDARNYIVSWVCNIEILQYCPMCTGGNKIDARLPRSGKNIGKMKFFPGQ